MSSNFHTHSTFCDGKQTPEDIVLAALEQNLTAIGFSSHGYTPFDLRYCMKDTAGYIREIRRLQEKYKTEIEIYLGIEEDAHAPCERSQFDYIIGSSHYSCHADKLYPIDSNIEYFKTALAVWDNDAMALAEEYYAHFCRYITTRKPDIIGHYDVVTKFDESGEFGLLGNPAYHALVRSYTERIANIGCLFEINTGAIARGLRTTPYPHTELLHLIKKAGGKVIPASDSHDISTLCFGFDEAKKLLKDIGFSAVYTMRQGEFVPETI